MNSQNQENPVFFLTALPVYNEAAYVDAVLDEVLRYSSHVLVVDDVITTGETCRQLAVTLLDAGVKRVSALAIARALRD